MTIETKIRAIMKATGWKQMQLADELSVSQSTVNRWLSGAEPEGHRRDAINELFERFADQTPVGEDDRLKRAFARAAKAPEPVKERILRFIEFELEPYEKSRETETTAKS